MKVCKSCEVSKELSDFEPQRSMCKTCRKESRSKRRLECKEKRTEIPECPDDHTCKSCSKTRGDGSFFKFRSDILKGGFSSICNDCFNQKKYYKTYRTKRKSRSEESKKEFLKHNATIMAQWREKNKETYAEYIKNYRKKHSTIVNRTRASSKARNIHFEENDRSYFESILSLPCHYCGSTSNGLDRVDSQSSYKRDNVVQSCTRCNLMKLTFPCDSFIRKVFQIVAKQYTTIHNLEKEKIDFYTNFSHRKTKINDEKKKVSCDPNLLKRLKHQNCYLCGGPGGGIDRFDSDIGYTSSNIRPCCSMCNYMKKDYSFEAFLYQCGAIHNHLKNNFLLMSSYLYQHSEKEQSRLLKTV